MTRAASGRFSGDGGCNRLGGSFTQAGAALTLGQAIRTMMACIGPGMDIEQRLVDALQRVKSWAIADRVLTLGDGSAPLLTFQAR